MGRQRKWTDDQLRAAVAASTSWRQAAVAVGISESGNSYRALRNRADDLQLDVSHFRGQGWNKGTGQGRDPELQRAAKRRWYEANRQVYLDRNARKRDEKVRVIRQLRERPCGDCGGSFPYYCMDFDHRPGVVKEFSIANAVRSQTSLARILAEIEKCDLVCAICHRIRTATRAGYAIDDEAGLALLDED